MKKDIIQSDMKINFWKKKIHHPIKKKIPIKKKKIPHKIPVPKKKISTNLQFNQTSVITPEDLTKDCLHGCNVQIRQFRKQTWGIIPNK